MNRLKELRKEKRVRQSTLGTIIDVSERTISRWEKGENKIPSDKAQALADYFGVSVGYLLGFTDDNRIYDDEREELYPNGTPYFYSPKRIYEEQKVIFEERFIKVLRDSDVLLSDKNIKIVLELVDSMRLDNPNTPQGEVFVKNFLEVSNSESLKYADYLEANGFKLVLSLE